MNPDKYAPYYDRESFTMFFPPGTTGYRAGDRLIANDFPNRVRLRVLETPSPKGSEVEIAVNIRPSRGYAKHVRRMKQEKRA